MSAFICGDVGGQQLDTFSLHLVEFEEKKFFFFFFYFAVLAQTQYEERGERSFFFQGYCTYNSTRFFKRSRGDKIHRQTIRQTPADRPSSEDL